MRQKQKFGKNYNYTHKDFHNENASFSAWWGTPTLQTVKFEAICSFTKNS